MPPIDGGGPVALFLLDQQNPDEEGVELADPTDPSNLRVVLEVVLRMYQRHRHIE